MPYILRKNRKRQHECISQVHLIIPNIIGNEQWHKPKHNRSVIWTFNILLTRMHTLKKIGTLCFTSSTPAACHFSLFMLPAFDVCWHVQIRKYRKWSQPEMAYNFFSSNLSAFIRGTSYPCDYAMIILQEQALKVPQSVAT